MLACASISDPKMHASLSDMLENNVIFYSIKLFNGNLEISFPEERKDF
jgi:hypothetical protein